MKDRWGVVIGVLGGLLGAGILLLITSQPRGEPITLSAPPTPLPVIVHVIGAVVDPGIYSLPPGSRVQDAITASGGLLDNAEANAINLAAYLNDGQQLYIPARQPTTVPAISDTRSQIIPTMVYPLDQTVNPTGIYNNPGGLININLASKEELESLPGIGPVLAQSIIDHRLAYGPFQTIEAIMDVRGIGEAKFEQIKDLITIGY